MTPVYVRDAPYTGHKKKFTSWLLLLIFFALGHSTHCSEHRISICLLLIWSVQYESLRDYINIGDALTAFLLFDHGTPGSWLDTTQLQWSGPFSSHTALCGTTKPTQCCTVSWLNYSPWRECLGGSALAASRGPTLNRIQNSSNCS